MNSQDFDYLSREIESIRRELGAGIPVPEKKSAAASASDTISFPSMKDYSGSSVTGWANRYMDGDRGVLSSASVSRALEHVPSSLADARLYLRDFGLHDPTGTLQTFSYDGSNTGSSLSLYWLYGIRKSNAITLTKVTSSIPSNSIIGRVFKRSESESFYDYLNSSTLPSIAEISSSITTYPIIDVVSGSSGSFFVSGDITSEITNGISFSVSGSTGNDKSYVCSSSSYSVGDDETTIVVSGTIPDTTPDGSIGLSSNCLMWNPMGIRYLQSTQYTNPNAEDSTYFVFNSSKNVWENSKRNFISNPVSDRPEGVYFDSIGSILFLCKLPYLNSISVPDSFIPKGHVCLQPVSPGSKTILVRLRHITTGELYEGTISSVYDGGDGQGNFVYGIASLNGYRPSFLYPDTNADLGHKYYLNLTMSTY
jgi:hypothetical protein